MFILMVLVSEAGSEEKSQSSGMLGPRHVVESILHRGERRVPEELLLSQPQLVPQRHVMRMFLAPGALLTCSSIPTHSHDEA